MGCVNSTSNCDENINCTNLSNIKNIFNVKIFKRKFKNFCFYTRKYGSKNICFNNGNELDNQNTNDCCVTNINNNCDETKISDLNMEIKMMNDLTKVMLNTSSPIFEERSFIVMDKLDEEHDDFDDELNHSNIEDNLSYAEWKNHLRNTEFQCYIVKDITRIPEAVADFKLDQLPENEEDIKPRNSQEWGSGWMGPEIIVEIQETAATDLNQENINSKYNFTNSQNEGPKLIVRTEEVFIVLFVLLLWIGAIALFFNRWGKIRMLEPYQPKFQQQHRSSCSLVDIDGVQTHPRSSISRMSMGMAIPIQMPQCQFSNFHSNIGSFAHTRGYTTLSRPRQNSVFVGPPIPIAPKPPRKSRSAIDIHTLVLDESAEQV